MQQFPVLVSELSLMQCSLKIGVTGLDEWFIFHYSFFLKKGAGVSSARLDALKRCLLFFPYS